jgi:MSHA biogenesis protein MshI
MFWRKRSAERPGWLAISADAQRVSYAYSEVGEGGLAEVRSLGTDAVGDADSLDKAAKRLAFALYPNCTTLLSPAEYQLLVVEAPNVPREELKAAIRWRIKDLIDYHVDDASVDVLDIPIERAAAPRGHSMFAVAARNSAIQSCVEKYHGAGVPLSVIDIPETAQRNISTLYADEGRGVALLHVGDEGGLLTISYAGELYLSRRIEVSAAALSHADTSRKDDYFQRILLELQRTFDHVERQFPWAAVSKLLIAPEPADSGLGEFLRGNVDIAVEAVDLRDQLRFPAEQDPDLPTQWRLFHLIGASLRHEDKVL